MRTCLVLTALVLILGPMVIGAPSLDINYCTSFKQMGEVRGTVSGVTPSDYYVAPVIFLPGIGWWSKPTCDQRVVSINSDGTWSATVFWAGVDDLATMVQAYLIPKASYPNCYPACLQSAECVPASLTTAAVACDRMIRPGQTQIRWSGYDWIVKANERATVGPGTNRFSDSSSNVWVDAQGRLHLRLTHVGSYWYCAEISSVLRFGYGTYRFYLDSPVDTLDPNVVFGLFTWSDFCGHASHREIDIEFSRWATPSNENSQFIIQPNLDSNKLRFNMPAVATSTHSFKWQPGGVYFSSVEGHCTSGCTLIHDWTFPQAAVVPPTLDERVHLNLWLSAPAPANSQEAEVIISRFEFNALPPTHRTCGITNRDTRQSIIDKAKSRFVFRVWGRVISADCGSLVINDGSISNGALTTIEVLEPDHGFAPGDLVRAEGLLDNSTDPPTLDASTGRIIKLN